MYRGTVRALTLYFPEKFHCVQDYHLVYHRLAFAREVIKADCQAFTVLEFGTLFNEGENKKMDFDTAILLVVTACAYCWFISFGIIEERKENKELEKKELDRLQRAERVKKLFGR